MFRGNQVTRVDEKGRLKIPADFKRDLRDEEQFYITSLDGKRGLLYPIAEWEEKEAVLAKIPSTNAAKMKFMDVTSYYGQMVKMDGQGRLLLPQLLRESAKLDADVAVKGNGKILEVMNHEAFRAQIEQVPLTAEDMAALAELGV